MADPAHFTCQETLRNGVAVTVRAVRTDDRDRLVRAFRLLDRASIYRRFFAFRSELTPAELDRITAPNSAREVGLVVTIGAGENEMIIGSGRYVACAADAPAPAAEVAFVVEEDHQGLGVAARLLSHLARIARENGIASLEAEVLADNGPMLAVLTRCGLPMRTRQEGGVVHVTLELRPEGALSANRPSCRAAR